jgi:hypothetical protein
VRWTTLALGCTTCLFSDALDYLHLLSLTLLLVSPFPVFYTVLLHTCLSVYYYIPLNVSTAAYADMATVTDPTFIYRVYIVSLAPIIIHSFRGRAAACFPFLLNVWRRLWCKRPP